MQGASWCKVQGALQGTSKCKVAGARSAGGAGGARQECTSVHRQGSVSMWRDNEWCLAEDRGKAKWWLFLQKWC